MKQYLGIEKEGQQFIDDPIYAMPKRGLLPSALETGVRRALGTEHLHKSAKPIVLRYERVRLQWVRAGRTAEVGGVTK